MEGLQKINRKDRGRERTGQEGIEWKRERTGWDEWNSIEFKKRKRKGRERIGHNKIGRKWTEKGIGRMGWDRTGVGKERNKRKRWMMREEKGRQRKEWGGTGRGRKRGDGTQQDGKEMNGANRMGCKREMGHLGRDRM